MTAALEGSEWSAARPGRTLPPGKSRYPFYRRLGGPQGRYGRAENLVLTGIRSRTFQPVVSHYTEAATHTTQNKGKRRTSMPSARYQSAIPSIKRQYSYALDRTVTGIGYNYVNGVNSLGATAPIGPGSPQSRSF